MDTARIHHRHVEPDEQPRAFGQGAEMARDDFGRIAHDLLAALPAERAPDPGEEQPQVIVNLGGGADGRSGVSDAVLLANRNGRTDPFDAIDVGLLHALEELPRIRGQRAHVPALPLGVDRVEGERRLARSAHAGDDDQLSQRKRQIDVLQIVRARAADDDRGSGCARPEFRAYCGEFRRIRKLEMLAHAGGIFNNSIQ